MCGLAGWAATAAAPDAQALAPMVEALAHRNADEALCAVIDAHPRRTVVMAAALSDPALGISVALDGAILNAAELRAELGRHGIALAAANDAELLAHAYQYWDKEVVKRLRGAFAFALWDARKDRLMLARDRYGQKPLHLRQASGVLYFASELKALVRAPGVKAELDAAALGDYLALRYVRGPRTLINGVRKLAPGSYALWQFGNLRETRYWSPPDGDAAALSPAPREPLAEFIARLDEAVRLHMDGARPLGAFLSGGYDSAAIVALMKRHSERVATFTAGFADDRQSELPAAARVAKHFGTAHREIVLARRDVLGALPQAVARRDAPFHRPADVALHLLAREAAREVKVALSGDGGDEILGGYRRHTFLRGFAPARKKMNGLFIVPIADPADPAPAEGGATSSLRRILYYEQVSWLADSLLERSDRMTAAASLELRAPFLDHRLAEYVSALPDAARVRGLSTKWILRRADEKLLADAPLKPRKRGFRIPLGDLMRTEARELVVDHLRGAGCRTRTYCDGTVLDRLIDEHLAGKRNHEELLWTLLNLEIWHRTYLRG